MLRYKQILLALCIGVGFFSTAGAGTHSPNPQYAILNSLDKSGRTIVVGKEVYKLRIGVKIHDSSKKLPGLSSLVIGEKIKFQTRINKSSGQVEISEIWALKM